MGPSSSPRTKRSCSRASASTIGTSRPTPPCGCRSHEMTLGACVACALVLAGGAQEAQRGARVPFVEYQAEAATTDGTVLGPSRSFGTLAAEASGRKAVRLQAGQYVEFTLREPANAVDVRNSIADGATAVLDVVADGDPLAELPLTSAYSWFYGGFPFTNDARDGGAHHFYDDARTLLGTTLPAG